VGGLFSAAFVLCVAHVGGCGWFVFILLVGENGGGGGVVLVRGKLFGGRVLVKALGKEEGKRMCVGGKDNNRMP